MTTVCAVMARSYTRDMFDDLDVPAHTYEPPKRGGVTTLIFDGELTDEQVTAVRDRMTSRNDDDQAARADLRAKRDAVIATPTLANAIALSVALTNYQLGESP